MKLFDGIIYYPVSFWVEKLKKNMYFSLARYGDGEWLCIQGRGGHNSHGCNYTPELRADLMSSLENPDIYHGMQRILPEQFEQIKGHLKGKWVDTEVLVDDLAKGELKQLFKQLKKMEVVIISSAEKRNIPFKYRHFIETPRTNSHTEKERILGEVLEYNRPAVYLFSCGMAAGTFVNELHGKIPESFFIDFGHLWDPFVGENSRFYLNDVSPELLKKNL